MTEATEGVVYIATGETHVNQAVRSATQIKELTEDYPITLIADCMVDSPAIDQVMRIDSPKYANQDVVENLLRTPYEKTLCLDTDTYVVDSRGIDDIFKLLERFDLAIADDPFHRMEQFYDSTTPLPDIPVPDSFDWFNCGIFAFELNDRVREQFSKWEEIHHEHLEIRPDAFDQAAFRQMLYQTDLRYALLPPEYNFLLKAPQPVSDPVKIIHGNVENVEEIAEQLTEMIPETSNEGGMPEQWIFTPVSVGGEVRLLEHPHCMLRKRLTQLELSIRNRGFRSTVEALIRWMRGGEFHG